MTLPVRGKQEGLLTNAVEKCFGILLDLPERYQQHLQGHSKVYGLDFFNRQAGLVLRDSYGPSDLYTLSGPLGIEYQALKLKQTLWEETAPEIMNIPGLEYSTKRSKNRTVYELVELTSKDGSEMRKALDRYERQVHRAFQGRTVEEVSADLKHCLNASILPGRRRLWSLTYDKIAVRGREVSKEVVALCLDQRDICQTARKFQGRLGDLYGSALIAGKISPHYPKQRLATFFRCVGPLSLIFSLGVYGSRLFNGEDPFRVSQDFAYEMMTGSLSFSSSLAVEGIRAMVTSS